MLRSVLKYGHGPVWRFDFLPAPQRRTLIPDRRGTPPPTPKGRNVKTRIQPRMRPIIPRRRLLARLGRVLERTGRDLVFFRPTNAMRPAAKL